MLRCFVICVAALVLAGAWPFVALAHPLGNFTISHYSRIEVEPSRVRIFYVLDIAEIPTFQVMQSAIDQDRDGQMSQSELERYGQTKAAALANNLQLLINGQPVALAVQSPVVALIPGQGNLSTLRLNFWLDGALVLPTNDASPTSAQFINNNEPDRLGWREIIVRGAAGVVISEANVSDKDVSDELHQYPQDMLQSPLKQTRADFRIALTGTSQPNALPSGSPTTIGFGTERTDAQFAALINQQDLTPSVIAFALLTAVALGALHALEPGHGKSVAAAYLVGARATPWHAVLLGLTITVTHTFSVYLMGFVTLFASSYILPERLLPWLGLLSGVIVIVIGINMVVGQLWARKTSPSHTEADHAHDFDATTGSVMHRHGGKAHTHAPPGGKLSARNVLAVGVSGGLVPCPAGIIVMLSAIGLGRLGLGLVLIVAFSLGLALVLTAVGLVVLYSRQWLNKQRVDARIAQALPVVGKVLSRVSAFSGVLVIGAGALLLYHALPFLRVWWG